MHSGNFYHCFFLLIFYLSFKIFKNKYKDDFYPYLLPKSHYTANKLPFTIPGVTKASVQVHVCSCSFPHFIYFVLFFAIIIYLCLFLFHTPLYFSPRFFVLSIAGPLAHVNIQSSMPMYMLLRTASITFI